MYKYNLLLNYSESSIFEHNNLTLDTDIFRSCDYSALEHGKKENYYEELTDPIDNDNYEINFYIDKPVNFFKKI